MVALKQAIVGHEISNSKRKRQFAEFLSKLSDPYKAAHRIFPEDTKLAIQAAREWPTDRTVIDFLNEKSLSKDDVDELPTKADLARCVWDRMNEPMTENEDFVKMAKLYAEIRGFVEKPKDGAQVNVQNVSNVLVVKENGDFDNWSNGLAQQQERLINGSN